MIGINKGQPIAVLDSYGMILPFTTNGVDAIHCLRLGVTYIYTEAELKAIIKKNEALHNQHDFENPKLHTKADHVLRIPRTPESQKRESRIEIINPEKMSVSDPI